MRVEGLDAVLVDLDGTLVDTLGDFVHALDLMLDDLGLPHCQGDPPDWRDGRLAAGHRQFTRPVRRIP